MLLIDDHRLFADAIRRLLDENGFDVVGVAATGSEGVEMARQTQPHLVLVDMGLPDGSGIEFGARVLRAVKGTKAIAVTARGGDRTLSQQVISRGFHGFLPKDLPLEDFVRYVKEALAGEKVVRWRSSDRSRSSEQREALRRAQQLTPRERDVLTLLVQGASSKEIADELFLSANTIRSHVQNILTKLQVHSRLDAATFATRHGIVETKEQRP